MFLWDDFRGGCVAAHVSPPQLDFLGFSLPPRAGCFGHFCGYCCEERLHGVSHSRGSNSEDVATPPKTSSICHHSAFRTSAPFIGRDFDFSAERRAFQKIPIASIRRVALHRRGAVEPASGQSVCFFSRLANLLRRYAWSRRAESARLLELRGTSSRTSARKGVRPCAGGGAEAAYIEAHDPFPAQCDGPHRVGGAATVPRCACERGGVPACTASPRQHRRTVVAAAARGRRQLAHSLQRTVADIDWYAL